MLPIVTVMLRFVMLLPIPSSTCPVIIIVSPTLLFAIGSIVIAGVWSFTVMLVNVSFTLG